MPGLVLVALPGEFSICRLPPGQSVPAWAGSTIFSSITRTKDELSIVCPTAQVPAETEAEHGWRLIGFAGPFDFASVGVLASVTEPLARVGISVLAIGTFETDYVLVKTGRLDLAIRTLETAGHLVRR